LRGLENTTYSFHCPSCAEAVKVDFGWILRWENPEADLSANIIEDAYQLFGNKLHTYFVPTKCFSCEKMFLVHARIDETLNNAFRVKLLGVAEIIKELKRELSGEMNG